MCSDAIVAEGVMTFIAPLFRPKSQEDKITSSNLKENLTPRRRSNTRKVNSSLLPLLRRGVVMTTAPLSALNQSHRPNPLRPRATSWPAFSLTFQRWISVRCQLTKLHPLPVLPSTSAGEYTHTHTHTFVY